MNLFIGLVNLCIAAFYIWEQCTSRSRFRSDTITAAFVVSINVVSAVLNLSVFFLK